jgi:hypothetical protein
MAMEPAERPFPVSSTVAHYSEEKAKVKGNFQRTLSLASSLTASLW